MRCAGAVFSAVLLNAGPGFACELPVGGVQLSPQSETELTGAMVFTALPTPVSGPFEAQVIFCPSDKNTPVTRVQIDARMPAHQHGMNYFPVVTHSSENRFEIENLVFHMPGAWEIAVSAFVGEDVTHFTLDVPAK